MTTREGCRFCNVATSLTFEQQTEPWNIPLWETEHYFVVPSLGSLVEGWLLIVTKEHHLCMGSVAEHQFDELSFLVNRISNLLRSIYGPVAVFEHGPASSSLPVGCGVDHAHIHVVPVSTSLVEEAEARLGYMVPWSEVSGMHEVRTAYKNGESYLYIQQDGKAPLLYTGDGIPSQLFRKSIASVIGNPDGFNWRDHAHESVIASTIDRLVAAIRHEEAGGVDVEAPPGNAAIFTTAF